MQTEYRVHLELNKVIPVCYEANESHSEEDAIEYVLNNYMNEIKAELKKWAWADSEEV